jgi:hypothetical protein
MCVRGVRYSSTPKNDHLAVCIWLVLQLLARIQCHGIISIDAWSTGDAGEVVEEADEAG